MDDAYYQEILEKSLDKFIFLVAEKERIADETAKLEQFMSATMNLLSDEASAEFEAKWQPYIDKITVSVATLKDSVKKVLSNCYPTKMTAAQIRDQLRANKFDFSAYKSDPLPSVSTTLRRLRESDDVFYEEFEGVTVYQAKPPEPHKTLTASPTGDKE